jgi:hypothetical protein
MGRAQTELTSAGDVSFSGGAQGARPEREYLLDRLMHLRAILPSFAEELAAARRQAASLRVENRLLIGELRRLRGQDGARSGLSSPSTSAKTDQRCNQR